MAPRGSMLGHKCGRLPETATLNPREQQFPRLAQFGLRFGPHQIKVAHAWHRSIIPGTTHGPLVSASVDLLGVTVPRPGTPAPVGHVPALLTGRPKGRKDRDYRLQTRSRSTPCCGAKRAAGAVPRPPRAFRAKTRSERLMAPIAAVRVTQAAAMSVGTRAGRALRLGRMCRRRRRACAARRVVVG